MRFKELFESYEGKIPQLSLSELSNSLPEECTQEQCEKILSLTLKAYQRSTITRGESIGIISAESIGEQGTQMTLDTFHTAGVAELNVTTGLPRIIEIFDGRKLIKTPVTEIFLNEPFNTVENITSVAQKIKETRFEELASKVEVNIYELTIIVDMDQAALKVLGFTVKDILKLIKSKFKNFDVSANGNKIIFTYKGKSEDLKDLFALREKLKIQVITGVKGISHVLPVKRGNEYIILASGINLSDLFELDEVDNFRTISNDIHECHKILGIEATRQLILEEVLKVVNGQGLDIDTRHVMLVADTMCASGEVMGITRYGVVNKKSSVLAKASFETPITHFIKAALYNEKESLDSVVENVMINQPVPSGTSLTKLKIKLE